MARNLALSQNQSFSIFIIHYRKLSLAIRWYVEYLSAMALQTWHLIFYHNHGAVMYFKSNIFPYPPTFLLCSFNIFFQALLKLSVFIFKLEFSSTIIETISSKYLFQQMTKVSQFRWPIHLEMEQLWNAWLYTLINISFVRWDTFKPSSL